MNNNKLKFTGMKSKIKYLICSALVFMNACDLDVDVLSQITPENFPQTEEDFIAVSGPIYSNLAAYYSISFFFLQEATADGCVLTANGSSWFDDARYRNHHLHTWYPDQRFIQEAWRCCFSGISLCNSLLPILDKAPETTFKPVAIAEIRAMRAWYYFMAMDLWGDVPLVTEFGAGVESGPRVARKTIFEFIETELKEALPDLSGETGLATYGRPHKWMVYALLAKMYLNATVYTGEARYADVVGMCDQVIAEAAKGGIALDDDYLKMFYPDNGPQVKDFLFAVPYDSNYSGDVNYPGRYWLSPYHRDIFGLPFGPSSCMRTWPEFYAKFTIDATDVRQKIWLAGKQYLPDGTPILIPTTNFGLDNTYSGPDPNAAINWHMEFSPEVTLVSDVSMFDTGNDIMCRHKGYRSVKFYPDLKSASRAQSNDIPILRYADVLLMKAEAILRGAAPTMGHTAVSLVNMVRSRAKASPFTTINMDGLLDERARELAFEYWRRNDLIRFGKFEDAWGVKTDNDVRKRVLPIPLTELTLNPKMTQNPGYDDIKR